MAALNSDVLRKMIAEKLRQHGGPGVDVPSAHDGLRSEAFALSARDIAVIGVHCRFPGSANAHEYMESLLAGQTFVDECLGQRFDGLDSRTAGLRFGALRDTLRFDNRLFRLSPREAECMDPHHRNLLESVWSCIEDCGYTPAAFAQHDTGVFVALYNQDFAHLSHAADWENESRVYVGTGRTHSMLPNRISHLFDLRGPSELVDTACSSGLVAVHRAVQAIHAGECVQAVVGGVSLLIDPERIRALDRLGILCGEGTSRLFDENPNGQTLGEGVATLILKRLSAAQTDRDHIYGVIRGSRVGHGGRSSGTMVLPDAAAQSALIDDLFRDLPLRPRDVSYVEAHGSGGNGDRIELAALRNSYAADVHIGSVKGNIGCLEAAGGLSQLIKVAMAFDRGLMPPTQARGQFSEDGSHTGETVRIVMRPLPIALLNRHPERPCLIAVNAYGLGGVNAHLLMQAPPHRVSVDVVRSGMPILLTARTVCSLRKSARALLTFIRGNASLNHADVAFSLAFGRVHDDVRVGWVASNLQEIVAGLEALLERDDDNSIGDVAALLNAERFAAGGAPLLDAIEAWRGGQPVEWRQWVDAGSRISLPPSPLEQREFPLPVASPRCSPRAASTFAPAGSIEASLSNWLTRQGGLEPGEVGVDTPLGEYGIDSVSFVAMCAFIERAYGISAAPAEFADSVTLAQVLAHVRDKLGREPDNKTDNKQGPHRKSVHVESRGTVEAQRDVDALKPGDSVGAIRSVSRRHAIFHHAQLAHRRNLSPLPLPTVIAGPDEEPPRFEVFRDRNANIWIFLNTAAGNTFDLSAMEQLRDLIRDLHAGGALAPASLLYLSHARTDFSLGGDRRFFANAVRQGRTDLIEAVGATYMEILAALAQLDCLTVGVVYGNALGGGCELLMALDFQLAWPGVKLGFPEVRSGLIAGMGGISYLTSLVGANRAMHLNVAGEIVHSEEAASLGMITRVCDEPFAEAMRLHEDVADMAAALTVRRAILKTKYELMKRDVDTWVEFVRGGDFMRRVAKIEQDFELIERPSGRSPVSGGVHRSDERQSVENSI